MMVPRKVFIRAGRQGVRVDNGDRHGGSAAGLTRSDPGGVEGRPEELSAAAAPPIRLEGKRILFVLPPRNFRDEEYAIPRALLDLSGARVTVASLSLSPVQGMAGSIVHPDILIEDAEASAFDAVLLVGGTGSSAYWHDRTVHNLLNDVHRSGGTIGAICLAPVTLANAGLLKGKTVTAYPSARDFLAWKGAVYTGKPVDRTGNIVTAKGPEAAEEFGRVLAMSVACGVPPSPL